jgi:NADH-quinone oxidoreductase subunit A
MHIKGRARRSHNVVGNEPLRRVPPLPRGDPVLRGGHARHEPHAGPKPAATASKLDPFECGAIPVEARNVKPVAVKYYGIAVAFILFDLETVFLILWALAARPLGDFMMATFAIFAFLLVLILLYVYKARLLEAVTE